MNNRLDLERRLATYYEGEAPMRAPDWVLTGALATIEVTQQRRPFIRAPWRIPSMNGFPRLAAVVVAAGAIAALGVAVLSGGGFKWPGPMPSASPTGAPQATPTVETASTFRPPFTYVLPQDVQVDYGPRTSRFFEFRVPDSGGVGQAAWFLVVQTVGGGRAFPCSATPGRIPLADAQAAMRYLETVPTMTVSGTTTALISGQQALTATLTLEAPTEACQQLSLWLNDDSEVIQEAFRNPAVAARVMLLDVGGEVIAIHTWATSESLDWFRWADEIIASIHFQP